ncbi:MAG: glucose 1-dehydrogenase [Gammaproteobacteria bacterium]|nr:MAG: glucose 1-dehydrogenase [Gammaproteobacteria bacterium]
MTGEGAKPLLQGVRVLVTGGAQGLGLAIATCMARHGAVVALMDRNRVLVEESASNLPGDGHIGLAGDVTSPEQREQAVSEAFRRLGRLDTLVNNAGIQLHAPAEQITQEQWDRVMSVNLTAVLMMSQLVARRWIDSGSPGSIINIGSLNAAFGMPRRGIYGTSKTAVVGLTRSLAVDWARHRIRVNVICPGYHRTPLYEEYRAKGAIDENRILARIPMRRIGEPGDIGKASVFLSSDLSQYVTGQVLFIDGGYSIYGAAEDAPS